MFIFSATKEKEKMNMVSRMPAEFISKEIDVVNRLQELGWTREELLEVVDAMVAARFSCTDNDPVSAPGWMAWKDGTRRLREIGKKYGLVNVDEDQIPWLVDEKRGLRFAVANTNDATADQSRIPQNRSRKGAATDRVIAENEAMLFDLEQLPEFFKPRTFAREAADHMESWYLCVYAEGDVVTAELSCPVAINGGYFGDFRERIVLISLDDHDLVLRSDYERDSAEEKFDIPVTKKKSI